MVAVAAIIGSYLVGGIPVGILIARRRGVDLWQVGSGNIGATNVYRALGAKLGLLSFALDALKGFLPVSAAELLGVAGWALAGCAGATVIGHCFSPYLRLSGGKGAATSLGMALALFWPSGAVPFVLWVGLTALSRYVSLASIVALAAAPAVALVRRAPTHTTVTLACIAAMTIARHHENIGRLLAGTESRIGSANEGAGEPGPPPGEGGDE